LTKETTVRGVFACGDAALAQHSVTFAMADGARAGIFAHQSLVFAREAPSDAHTGSPVAR
jgi:thioredoxin reductase